MGLSSPRTIFGVHALTFFSRATGMPVGILKVVGGIGLALNGSFIDLFGGSSRYPVDSEPGTLSLDISLKARQFESFLFEKALGASATTNAAEANGFVGTLTNKKGATVMEATTGIASAAAKAGAEADLKDGRYIVKAVSPTTVDVYALLDVDFAKGTAKSFENDALKITATPLTITAATGVEIPGFGVELTGGSGAVGMTADDTAIFEVRKQNAGSTVVTVGADTTEFTEFGVAWAAQKKANGDTTVIYVPRVKALGLPLNLNEMAWAECDVAMKGLYDPAENMVYKVTTIQGVAA